MNTVFLKLLALLVGCFLFIAVVNAAEDNIKTLTAPEVKNKIETQKALLVHVLSAIEFEVQHIPGSVNIPIVQMKSTEKLPKDKDTPVIFYCMGER